MSYINFSENGNVLIEIPIRPSNINSVAMHIENMTMESDMFSLKYQISLDGQQWMNIQPVTDEGSVAEIIYINQPWFNQSINLEQTTFDKIYLKLAIEKKFNNDAIKKLIGEFMFYETEFINFPNSTPFSISLKNPAIPESVKLSAITNLSVGKKNANVYKVGETIPDIFSYVFDLPFDTKELEDIYIGDTKLNRIPSLNKMYDVYEKGYFIDNKAKKLYIFLDTEFPFIPEIERQEPWLEKSIYDGSLAPNNTQS